MLRTACIYNPQLGDEEHVDNQLVFTYGNEVGQGHFIKMIGVAQGVAELAASFDGRPVTHIVTKSELILVARLEAEANADDWRNGYWFSGSLDANTLASPDMVRTAIEQAYSIWRLLHGTLASSSRKLIVAWWTKFCDEFPRLEEMPYLLSGYLRLAAGTLSPSTRHAAQEACLALNAADLLVVTLQEGAAVYPGSMLDHRLRANIQLWLQWQVLRSRQRSSGDGTQTGDETDKTSDHANEESGKSLELLTPTSSVKIGDRLDNPNQSVDTEDPVELGESEEENTQNQNISRGSGWNFSSYLSSMPSMPSLPTMTLPSISMPSLELPSFKFWGGSDEEEPPTGLAALDSGFVPSSDLLHSDNEILWPVIYKRNQFVYVLLFKHQDFPYDQYLQSILTALAIQFEGFGFAFAPPTKTRFSYIVLDENRRQLVSTFPENILPGVRSNVASLVHSGSAGVVQRTARWWFSRIDMPGVDNVRVIFGRQGASSGLVGQLHRDTREWLEAYKRFI